MLEVQRCGGVEVLFCLNWWWVWRWICLVLFFFSIAPVKASAANVCLKSAAWSLQQWPLFLQWCEKRRLILFPRVLFGLSSFCMENIRSCVSAKVPFRVCRWYAPKKQQTWAGLSHFWLVYADPRCLWARAPTASQKCSSRSPLYFQDPRFHFPWGSSFWLDSWPSAPCAKLGVVEGEPPGWRTPVLSIRHWRMGPAGAVINPLTCMWLAPGGSKSWWS